MVNLKKGSAGLNENMEAARHNFLLRGYFRKKKKEEDKKKKELEVKNAKPTIRKRTMTARVRRPGKPKTSLKTNNLSPNLGKYLAICFPVHQKNGILRGEIFGVLFDFIRGTKDSRMLNQLQSQKLQHKIPSPPHRPT